MRTGILAAAVLLATAGSAIAQMTQPQTFSVFPKGQRNAGTYTTASATIPDGADSAFITDLLTDAEASDPTNRYDVVFEASYDGLTWFAVHLEHWQGGMHFDKRTGTNVPNHMETGFKIYQPGQNNGIGLFPGMRVRATIDNPQKLNLGFNVTLNPPQG